MTAVPRDPAFWKRFSVAIHLEEDKPKSSGASASSYDDPKADDWLEGQRRKERRSCRNICFSVLGLVIFLALVVGVIIWLARHGFFMHGEEVTFP